MAKPTSHPDSEQSPTSSESSITVLSPDATSPMKANAGCSYHPESSSGSSDSDLSDFSRSPTPPSSMQILPVPATPTLKRISNSSSDESDSESTTRKPTSSGYSFATRSHHIAKTVNYQQPSFSSSPSAKSDVSSDEISDEPSELDLSDASIETVSVRIRAKPAMKRKASADPPDTPNLRSQRQALRQKFNQREADFIPSARDERRALAKLPEFVRYTELVAHPHLTRLHKNMQARFDAVQLRLDILLNCEAPCTLSDIPGPFHLYVTRHGKRKEAPRADDQMTLSETEIYRHYEQKAISVTDNRPEVLQLYQELLNAAQREQRSLKRQTEALRTRTRVEMAYAEFQRNTADAGPAEEDE